MESFSPPEKRISTGAQAPADGPAAEAPRGGPAGDAGATTEPPAAEIPTTEIPTAESHSVGTGAVTQTAGLMPAIATAGRAQCPACAAPLAPDQRYCVECGQRLANARPPLMNERAGLASSASATPPRGSRWRMSPNSALIAGIATLLLAMGVGVLIGRSGQSSSSKPTTTPIVTVPSAGTSGVGTSTQSVVTSSATASTVKSAAASAKVHAAKSAPTNPVAAAIKPTNPTVKIGQKGTGPGYQHKHFTGHFFGAENEEEAGEESGKSGKGAKK
jgi:hypothetical protein